MQVPLALEEREDGFLYTEHGERLGTAAALSAGSVTAVVQEPQKKLMPGVELVAAEELLALQGAHADLNPEGADYEYEDEAEDERVPGQVKFAFLSPKKRRASCLLFRTRLLRIVHTYHQCCAPALLRFQTGAEYSMLGAGNSH